MESLCNCDPCFPALDMGAVVQADSLIGEAAICCRAPDQIVCAEAAFSASSFWETKSHLVAGRRRAKFDRFERRCNRSLLVEGPKQGTCDSQRARLQVDMAQRRRSSTSANHFYAEQKCCRGPQSCKWQLRHPVSSAETDR